MSPNHLSVVDQNTPAQASADQDLIREFAAQADVAERTRYSYRVQIEEFRSWLSHPKTRRATGHANLCDATRADVTRFMAYLTAGSRYAAPQDPRLKQVLSPSSRKRFIASLKSFYCYLMTVDLVNVDPTYGVARPKIKLKPGMHLSADELRRLLEAPGTPRDRVQVYLLAFTAARSNEIRCLRWRDVNFTDGTLRLHGKGDKYRVLDIHPRLMPELRRWRMRQDVLCERDPSFRAVRENPETDYVLLTNQGKQLSDSAIYKQLKRRAARAGLYVLDPAHREYRSEISPHVLRRTFATILLNAGCHLDAVSDVLGHEYADTTRKHYAFSSDARRRATIESFDV